MGEELLVGLGLCTPLGISAQMSLATMRAGILRIAETEVLDGFGEPVRASRLQLLEPSLSRTERMIVLGREALAEVWSLLEEDRATRVPLYLGVPEPGMGAEVDHAALVESLRSVVRGQIQLVGTYDGGRAGFFEALAAARKDLRSGRQGSIALVGAVDSLSDEESLSIMVEERRHLGPENRDGRIPGEAAGFVIVARHGAAEAKGRVVLGQVLGASLGVELRPFSQQAPSTADGLTQVFQALRADSVAGARRVDAVLACQPGEAFWPTEFSRAYLRNASLMPEPLQVNTVGEYLGDAGAGAGPVMLGAALYGMARRAREGARALVYGCADGGRIGACVVQVASGI